MAILLCTRIIPLPGLGFGGKMIDDMYTKPSKRYIEDENEEERYCVYDDASDLC